MSKLKKILKIFGLILVNVILLLSAAFLSDMIDTIYYKMTIPKWGYFLLYMPTYFALPLFIYFYLHNTKFFKIGISLVIFFNPAFYMIILLANNTFSPRGIYKAFKTKSPHDYLSFYDPLTVFYNKNYRSVRSSNPLFISNTDSVLIRVDPGFFCWENLTNETKFMESSNCNPLNLYNDLSELFNCENGYCFVKKRCLENALTEFSNCIDQDSYNETLYFDRGRIYIQQDKYELALYDFLFSAHLKYDSIIHPQEKNNQLEYLLKFAPGQIQKLSKLHQQEQVYHRRLVIKEYVKAIEFCIKNSIKSRP